MSTSLYAQESINLEEVRKELQAARASSVTATRNGDSFSFDEGDLQKRRESLLAAEEQLLKELQGSEPLAPTAPVAAKVPSAIAPSVIPQRKAEPADYFDEFVEVQPAKPSQVVPVAETTRQAPPFQEVSQATPPPVETPRVQAPHRIERVSIPHQSQQNGAEATPSVERTVQRESATPIYKIEEPTYVVPPSAKSGSVSALSDLERIKNATNALESELASLRKSNIELQTKFKNQAARSASLQKELEEARDRLMMAESEVERFSGVMKTRNSEALHAMGATVTPAVTTKKEIPVAQQQVSVPTIQPVKREPRVAEDVLVGTVVADKANLRTGPGKDNSPFMTVPKGARLIVETRNGEWYRVITPTGTRAWVAAEVLAFGATGQASPTRTVRIKGYNAGFEDETFKIATGITPR